MSQNFRFKLGEQAFVFLGTAPFRGILTDGLLPPVAERPGRFFIIRADGSKLRVTSTAPPYLKLVLRQPADD
jgi:hypothetical protein